MGGGPRYPNGYIPDNVLITFGSGWSSGEGNWTHRLSVSSYSKHKALVDLAKQNTGKTLVITPGNNAYRDYAAQVYARKMHGNGAAVPGTSSHGGWWEGQNTLAIDYHNWSYVYGGDRNAFYRDVRAVGLTPGLISVPRGYPDEPWHVVDLEPWIVPSGGGSTPVTVEETDNEMDYLFQIDPQVDGRWVVTNYREGWMRVIPNGFQLDRVRAEKDVPKARPLFEFVGPQPQTAIAGLRTL